jgi:hypothetical protein
MGSNARSKSSDSASVNAVSYSRPWLQKDGKWRLLRRRVISRSTRPAQVSQARLRSGCAARRAWALTCRVSRRHMPRPRPPSAAQSSTFREKVCIGALVNKRHSVVRHWSSPSFGFKLATRTFPKTGENHRTSLSIRCGQVARLRQTVGGCYGGALIPEVLYYDTLHRAAQVFQQRSFNIK